MTARIPAAVGALLGTAAELWPNASVEVARSTSGGWRTPPGTREFVFVPNVRRPRLLLPASPPAAAATAVRRYSEALRPAERLVRSAGALLLRTGVADRLFPDRLRIALSDAGGSSIEDELAAVLGEPVRISLGLGNQRANQKPILQALSLTGRSLAWVKVGDSDVSRELVRTEADALGRVAALHLPGIAVPRVLALRSWRGMDLLVISALRTTARRRSSGDLPLRAMADLAAAAGLEPAPLRESGYWHGLTQKVDALGDGHAGRLRQVLTSVDRSAGGETFTFGAWHGDWAPWNMSRERSGLALWDWERFATGVPVGFDALHYRLRVALRDVGGTEPAGELLLASAADLLAAFDVPERLAAGTTALYLLELCTRYAAAATGPAGAPLRAFADELVDFTVRRAGAP